MRKYSSVEDYLENQAQWLDALGKLRAILLDTELEETLKWSIPVYTLKKKNIAGIGAFKSYVGIWFFQGVFLDDPHQLLINAQEGKTKGMRQIRFSSADEIDADILRPYILQAIQNQKEGKEIKVSKAKKSLPLPEELLSAFTDLPGLQKDFEAFTPGKQREFIEYIHEAKRSETRQRRLQKIIPMIREGIGLNDKYK